MKIVCESAQSPNIFTAIYDCGAKQKFAIYGPEKGEKFRISWRQFDYPSHGSEINTFGAKHKDKNQAWLFAQMVLNILKPEHVGQFQRIKEACAKAKGKKYEIPLPSFCLGLRKLLESKI